MFVHQAVFEALNPVGDTCSTETFLEVWKSLQKAGGPADGDRIFTEYQVMAIIYSTGHYKIDIICGCVAVDLRFL